MNDHTALPPNLLNLLPDTLAQTAEHLPLHRGERLFEQDNAPQRMFYVSSGEVALERCGENGERVILQRVRNGFLAEASLSSARYHCDAIVTRSGAAVGLHIDTLRNALQHNSDFAMRWVAMLSTEIRKLRSRCERLSLRGIEARLLHLIDSEGENGCLVVSSTLKNLAAELGVSHEALYRELTRMEQAGRIVRHEGELTAIR